MKAPLFLLNASMLLFLEGIASLRALFSSGESFLFLLVTCFVTFFTVAISFFNPFNSFNSWFWANREAAACRHHPTSLDSL